MTSDSYYWFYSTLAQVLGALIALLGVFAVYSLQQIRTIIEYRRRDLIEMFPSPEKAGSLELKTLLEKAKAQFQDTPKEERGKKLVGIITVLQNNIKVMKTNTIFTLIPLIIILAIAIVCLPFCEVNAFPRKWWVSLFIFELLSSVALFVYIGKFVFETITLTQFEKKSS